MERVVAGACRGCAAGGGLLRGKPSASPANGERANTGNSIDGPGSSDSSGYLSFGVHFGCYFGSFFGLPATGKKEVR
jgi:hypothetical protein